MRTTELRERIRFRRAALKELRDAYIGLVDGRHKSYTIGPRTLTRLDLDKLAQEIRQMENELDALESQATGGGSRRIVGIIPRAGEQKPKDGCGMAKTRKQTASARRPAGSRQAIQGGYRKAMNSGYSEFGANRMKRSLRDFSGRSGSTREDIDENLWTLRQRTRMLYMSAPMATSAIRNNRTAVVGTGLTLKAMPDYRTLGWTAEQAAEWAREVEYEFALWADSAAACDALGVNDFYQLQQVAMQGWLMSGDAPVLLKWVEPDALHPYSLRFHLIEADRCSTPMQGTAVLPLTTSVKLPNGNYCHDGVEVDSAGRVVAYHICNTHPLEYTSEPAKWKRVEAYGKESSLPNVLMVMDCERPEQYRGVPYLAPVIEIMKQYDRYLKAEVDAAVIQSFLTAFIKVEDPTGNIFNTTGPAENIPQNENEYQMGPGNVVFLQPNESVVFNDPTHPNTNFDQFTTVLANEVGAALEVPGSLILKRFTSNYTAARGELMEAWKAFKMRRSWLSTRLCQPIYERIVAEGVARGRIHAPGFFTNPR